MNANVELLLPDGLFVNVVDHGDGDRVLTLTRITLGPNNNRGQEQLCVVLSRDDARVLAAALTTSTEGTGQ